MVPFPALEIRAAVPGKNAGEEKIGELPMTSVLDMITNIVF